MEHRLQVLKSRRPTYLNVPPPPPPPPPPPLYQQSQSAQSFEPSSLNDIKERHTDDGEIPIAESLSIEPQSITVNHDLTTKRSISNVSTSSIVTHMLKSPDLNQFDRVDPEHADNLNDSLNTKIEGDNRGYARHEESTSEPLPPKDTDSSSNLENDEIPLKQQNILSGLGKKAIGLVKSVISSSSESGDDNSGNVSEISTDHGVNEYQLAQFDSNAHVSISNQSPTPWTTGDNGISDALDIFTLYFKLLSTIYPSITQEGERSVPQEDKVEEEDLNSDPFLDTFDVLEADEADSKSETIIQGEISRNMENFQLAVKSSLMQSIVPMLHEYTAEYMMQMPTRMKRSTKVITKSIRVRETILSQLDLSDNIPDIANADFERLLLELSSGPAEEIIEEIEYEYDEWPLHFEMLDDMEDHILGSINDEKYLIEFKTSEAVGAFDTTQTKDHDIYRRDKATDFDETDYDDDLLDDSDLYILEEAEPSDFGWISEDESE